MLTLYRNQKIFELERECPKLDVYVMSEEYARMESRLNIVSKESVSRYLNLFGYDGICFKGNGLIISGLKTISEHILKKDTSHKVLQVTEYIDTENCDHLCGYYNCGMRDVLYELKEFAVFPEEIKKELEYPEKFRDFAFRTVNGLIKNGWKVVFSARTPLSEWITTKYDVVQYIEEVKETYIRGEKIFVFKNGNLSDYYRFYRENKKRSYIESRRVIEIVKNWMVELLYEHFQSQLSKKGVTMYTVTRQWAVNHPLFPEEIITSEQIEDRRCYRLYEIRENQEPYIPFLKEIYGEKYSPDYVENVMVTPNKLELAPGKIRHEDYRSQYVNVVNGERYTKGNPIGSRHSIYLLGSCFFFGYAVEDGETVASYLQDKINTVYNDWRVINMGVMGASFQDIYKFLYDIKFRNGDIVVIEYNSLMSLQKNSQSYDISTALNDKNIQKRMYFDWILHCNHIGNKKLSDKLWKIIKNKVGKSDNGYSDIFYLPRSIHNTDIEETHYYKQAMEYIDNVKKKTPEEWKKGVRGAIVMNCNPFTLGHQYLIRQSAEKVDHLYIFVVEEDKSFFSFKDRIELVKAGTRNIKNVVVVPSGKLMISSVTFPGYFLKDSPDSVGVDTSLDVDIFGRYIATPLGITKRFVGEEPIDMVTRSYNDSMKEILPRYGIEVDEIKRKEKAGGVISASRVRSALQTGDFQLIKQLVPDTTYRYLWENRRNYTC